MNIKSVDYILNSRTIFGSHKAYWQKQIDAIQHARNIVLPLNVDEPANGLSVNARVENGRWIADCECGGATFVDPEDPRFFCFSCGNRINNGHPRPAVLPANYKEIELTLLERPVNDIAGLTDEERASNSRPVLFVEGKGGLSRNWLPGETVKDLHDQHDKPIQAWRKKIKGGK